MNTPLFRLGFMAATAIAALSLSSSVRAQVLATSSVNGWNSPGTLSSGSGLGVYNPTTGMVTGSVKVDGYDTDAKDWGSSSVKVDDTDETYSAPTYAYLKNNTSSAVLTNIPTMSVSVSVSILAHIGEAKAECSVASAYATATVTTTAVSNNRYSGNDNATFDPSLSEPNNILVLTAGQSRVYAGTMSGHCN